MNQHVGVSADGGGEVSVEGGGKAVVKELPGIVVGRTEVSGLVHASGRHYPHQFVEELVRFPSYLVQTLSQLLGGLPCQVVPHPLKDLPQHLKVSCLRLGVSPQDAQGRETFVDLFCHCDVGQQHELLDEVVGLDHLVHPHVSGVVGLLLDGDLDLGRGQSEGSLLIPPLFELPGDTVQVSDGLSNWPLVSGVHQLLGLHVGEGPSRPDDGLAAFGADDVGFPVDLPNGREGQSVDVGSEGAQVLGQQLGQHVSSTVDQVHRSASVPGLEVQGSVRLDVVTHVSNVHSDLEVTILKLNAVKGIVNVLAARRVDAHYINASQVSPVLGLGGGLA